MNVVISSMKNKEKELRIEIKTLKQQSSCKQDVHKKEGKTQALEEQIKELIEENDEL